MWPTPKSTSGGPSSLAGLEIKGKMTPAAYKDGKKVQVNLVSAVNWGLWPTPRSCSAMAAPNIENRVNDKFKNLESEVARSLWPTPAASMHKGSSPAALTRKSGRSRENDQLDHAVMASDGGALNPEWVEWLMGFPLGWTDLADGPTNQISDE